MSVGEYRWEVRSSASAAELAARIEDLLRGRIHFDRNLAFPPEYPRTVDETGFSVAVTPVWGGHAMLLLCSGRFHPREAGTVLAGEAGVSRPATPARPGAERPRLPWWELLGAGVFLLLGSVYVWWYLDKAEASGETLQLPAAAVWLYGWGGKWACVAFVAGTGAVFSAAGVWKLVRRARESP